MDQISIPELLLDAWSTPHEDYLLSLSPALGSTAIQYGLLGLWQQIDLDRCSSGLKSIEGQVEQAKLIASNPIQLIQEIITENPNSNKSIQDDVRILGLIALCISRSEPLPGDLLEDLSLQRESIDMFALSIFHSRTFAIAQFINKFAPEFTETSRVFDSLINYILYISDSTHHRSLIISNTQPLMITPWPRFTNLLAQLIAVSDYLHDFKYYAAYQLCSSLLDEFPSCPEVRYLFTLSCYFSRTIDSSCLLDKLPNPDPLLLYSANSFHFHPLDRLTYLSTFNDSIVHQLCDPKDLPHLGLDAKFYEIRSQLQIQLSHNKHSNLDLKQLSSSYTDSLLQKSSYDPFKLALCAAQVKKIDSSHFLNPVQQLSPELPCQLIFVVGLPCPHLIQLKNVLRECDDYAVQDSSHLLNHLLEQIPDIVSQGYPVTLEKLSEANILTIRLAYLQNLAFCFGGQDKNLIIDFIPNLFEHIGLLSKTFPEATFFAMHSPVTESILASYLGVNGFSSDHATATLSELTAYCFDYSDIIHSWKTILGQRLTIIPFTSSVLNDDIQSLSSVFSSIDASYMIKAPTGLFQSNPVLGLYPFLDHDLLEYQSDICEINQLLSSLAI